MTWVQILLLLACPLMMVFCMKGMFSGNKNKKSDHQQDSSTELQSLQIQMADLIELNHNLTKEVQSLKEERSPVAVFKRNA